MTQTLEIITSAYREGNLIALGATLDEPRVAEGLKRLNVLVSSAYGSEVGESFFDWPVGLEGVEASSDWTDTQWKYPTGNARIIAAASTPQEVFFPPEPNDGARMTVIDPAGRLAGAPITLNGNGRTLAGNATANAVAGAVWFYRADLGNWVVLSELTATDDEEFPFPMEFDDYFITKLAMRVNPRYGRSIDEQSVAIMTSTLSRLRARYRQRVEVGCDIGVTNLTETYGGRAGSMVVRGRLGWM